MLSVVSRFLLAALVVLAVASPSASASVRLRGLDAGELLFAASPPDRVIAGDLVVAAGTERVFGWPVTGGAVRRLGRLPDLGDASNDILDGGGFVRVEAAQAGRVVVVRGEGRAIDQQPDVEAGHHLVGGPPEGPFQDPAGCGERTGGPAGLRGDLLAYVAAPAGEPACVPPAAPAVRGPAIVVRDLAAGAAVVRVIPLAFDGSVAAMRFDGPFVGLELRTGPEDPNEVPDKPPSRALVVVDVRTGGEVTRVPVRGSVPWDIGPDGTLLRGRYRQRGATPTCPVRADRLRLHAVGEVAGRAVAGTPCGVPAPELRAGALMRLARPRPDGRIQIVDRRLDTATDDEIAVVSGPLLGGDDRHVVAADATCRNRDARVITVQGRPARPSGPLSCPFRLRAPSTVRSGRPFTVRVSCPRGCRGAIELQVLRTRDETTFGFGPVIIDLASGRARTVRFTLPRNAALERPSRGTLTVGVQGPVTPRTTTRRIIVRPANP